LNNINPLSVELNLLIETNAKEKVKEKNNIQSEISEIEKE